MQRTIEIKKVRGRWTVTVLNPLGSIKKHTKLFRGDKVTWKLYADPAHPRRKVSARLQFCHDKLVKGPGLTRDWTAAIGPTSGSGPKSLTLGIHHEATRKKKHYYAVWVCDPALHKGGTYAVGHNPPPEIDVGP